MRIDLYNAASATEATSHVDKISADSSATAKRQVGAQKTQTEDTTTLSSSSATVQSLTTTALETIPSRASKVVSLKLAVSSAQYQLDAAKIAEAITNSDV